MSVTTFLIHYKGLISRVLHEVRILRKLVDRDWEEIIMRWQIHTMEYTSLECPVIS